MKFGRFISFTVNQRRCYWCFLLFLYPPFLLAMPRAQLYPSQAALITKRLNHRKKKKGETLLLRHNSKKGAAEGTTAPGLFLLWCVLALAVRVPQPPRDAEPCRSFTCCRWQNAMCREGPRWVSVGSQSPQRQGPVLLWCRTLPCNTLAGFPGALSLCGAFGTLVDIACPAWSPSMPSSAHPGPWASRPPSIPTAEHPCPLPFTRATAFQPLKSSALITERSGCKGTVERGGDVIVRLGVIGSLSVSCSGFALFPE